VELDAIYNQTILHHSKFPKNFGTLQQPDGMAVRENPVCGDKIVLHTRTDGSILTDIRFTGHGCTLCLASASLMTEAVKAEPLAAVRALSSHFREALASGFGGDRAALRGLHVFDFIVNHPVRIKCVLLPWDALSDCLSGND